MRRSILAAFAAVLACSGVGAAVAVAGSGSNVACATTPAHTVAIDGSPVSTTPGDVECATAPTVTVTVTQAATTATTTTPTTTTPSQTYLFDEEFNGAAGSKPSSTLWGAKTGSSNGAVTWNGWNNISEDGQGDLVITAQKNSSGAWTSGFLSGKIGYSGPRRIEARARLACGAGVWDAPVWEWGSPYGGSPSIETDVNETLPGKDPAGEYHATLHNWNGGTNPQAGKPVTTGDSTLCTAFHTYAADVYPDHVDFYFDGQLKATTTAAAVGLTSLTTFKEVANVSLNMGGWGGTIGSETSATMLIDYVRVSAL